MELSEKLCSLIEKMREKPVMYIVKRDIFLLRSFLNGFVLACVIQGDKLPGNNLGAFSNWVSKKYHYEDVTIAWDSIFFLVRYGFTKDVLDMFFTEWDLFCEEIKNPERPNPSDAYSDLS